MATIDKLDMSVYNLYAIRTKMIEQINQQFRLEESSSIPPQTQFIDIYPKLSELDILLGIVPLATPWAYFFPPKKFRSVRKSPFSFARITPSLFSSEAEQNELLNLLEEVDCPDDEEKENKKKIGACLKQLDQINSWLGFIRGRIGQFLQG